MALFYFVLLPGLRPSAVSVICSTSTEGLVLQDAFAYGVLTNRLTPLGYASKDRKLPVRVKALRMQCFFLSAYMCAIVTVQKYLDGEKYAGGIFLGTSCVPSQIVPRVFFAGGILPGNIQIDQLDISATGLGEQYANDILRETSSNEYRTCFAVRSCRL